MLKFHQINLQSVDSTNIYLKTLIKDYDLEPGTVILSDFQVSGKGQGKNSWHSSASKNVLMSVLFKPFLGVKHIFSITEFISLSIVDMLDELSISSAIKWPNDIYVGKGKIAGILIENSIMGSTVSSCIAGIGLNVNEAEFPVDLPNPVSIKNITLKEYDRDAIVGRLLYKMGIRYSQLAAGNFDELHADYVSRLFCRNQKCRFVDANGEFAALLLDVNAKGELHLQKDSGLYITYLFGEVKMLV